jgi:hypothetical protein
MYKARGYARYECPPQSAQQRKFIPQDHQSRVTDDFLHSDQRGLILYHQLGSGKCVHGSTLIFINGQEVKIEKVWNECLSEITIDKQGGEWKTPLDLKTRTLPVTELLLSDGSKIAQPLEDFNISDTITRPVLKLYRERLINDVLKKVTFSDGSTLTLTFKHRLLCINNKKIYYTALLSPGMRILQEDGDETLITEVAYQSFSGYVYDLEVQETHAYLANGKASHNTCSAIYAVDNYLEKKRKVPVNIFLPASLTENFVTEYCSYCGKDRNQFPKFRFYSYNDPKIISKLPDNLNKSIVVIDEVHRVVNGARNKSATFLTIYNLILNARDVKILALTGTPIYGAPVDAAYLTNLIKPGRLPTDALDFDNNVMENVRMLAAAFSGIVSYVPVSLPERYPYPVILPIFMARMSSYQNAGYQEEFEKENKALRPQEEQIRAAMARSRREGNALKGFSYILNVRLLSRQKCNFQYPEERQHTISGTKNKAKESDKKYRVEKPFVDQLQVYSAKVNELIRRIACLPGKHYVYSLFKTHYGVYIVGAILEYFKIPFTTYTGDDSRASRKKNKENFNAPDNNLGQRIKVMLITGAGAMGISFMDTVHCHILEADLNEFLIKQVEGRGFRLDSQRNLPPGLKLFMIHRYHSLTPQGDDTTETMIYANAQKKYEKAQGILKVMRESAIDCRAPYGVGADNPGICLNPPVERVGVPGGGGGGMEDPEGIFAQFLEDAQAPPGIQEEKQEDEKEIDDEPDELPVEGDYSDEEGPVGDLDDAIEQVRDILNGGGDILGGNIEDIGISGPESELPVPREVISFGQ